MIVIAGLGNPGREYEKTRHNAGYDVLDVFAAENGIRVDRIKFKSMTGEGFIAGEKVLLIKPLTYMNKSGEAVREVLDFYKLDKSNLIILVDDIDIQFGSIRIRKRGSAGSHNGMKSIISHIGTDEFTRIKLGIGKNPEYYDLADYVLSKFSKEEREEIDKMIVRAAQATKMILTDGVDAAMNIFNSKNGAQE
ncbi:MAG: aminoacyl-tRNA hydrolase [Gudongella sp.]|nr:aminoacyl-tRNA hydrolase [Gudongella sp.]